MISPALARWQFLEPRRTRKAVSGYASLGEIVSETAKRVFTEPESITVSQSAEKYARIERAGAWSDFRNDTAPYMVEPMDITESRSFKGVVFVSSAQSGKTASLILNKMVHNIQVTGMDMMILCQSSSAGTDFAVRRVDRIIANSPLVKPQILPVRNSDNQKRKQFRNGMLLTISHPSKNELSGKPIGVVAITDYDRIEDDIDGEGSAYDLGSKRTQTFGSYAMTIAESSPSRPVTDPKRILADHEAPDCAGIMSLYNRGDRRMWYWPCPSCDEYFTPKWELIGWDRSKANHVDQAETAFMACPHCQHEISPDARYEMQQWGVWLAAGQTFLDGKITGEPLRSPIASFWLEGTAAAFITWQELVQNYLDAQKTLDDTGDEGPMMKFFNTDLGRPYVAKSQEATRLPEVLMQRAEPLGEKVIPEGVRFFVNCIDVQKNKFVVQAMGFAPGTPADIVIIDRYDVSKSVRIDDDGDHFMVRPSTFQEDWELLVEQVMFKSYPLADGSDRRMEPKITLCDSQGESSWSAQMNRSSGSGGVREKAFVFQRDLRRRGLAGRFHLVAGSSTRTGKRAWIDKPHAQNKDRFAIARGDVPVLMFNSNECKDVLANRLDVLEPGKGMIRFPDWLEPWFYGELCTEIWTDKGWKNPRGRNEAWDLLYYAVGLTFSPLLPLERIDWTNPPSYALPWDVNPFVIPAPEEGEDDGPRAFIQPVRKKIDFAAFGEALG